MSVLAFQNRHIGPSPQEQKQMLSVLGLSSFEELIEAALPENILSESYKQNTPAQHPPFSESEFLKQAQKLAQKNKVFRSLIGQGYSDCITPAVIQRNILENPGWYTAYTPYQAEISQGRMEALLNFQTLVTDLTQLDIANASLLDEGTAAAEAMSMALNIHRRSQTLLVDKNIFPQSLEVIQTRATPLGVKVIIADVHEFDFSKESVFGVILQCPNHEGAVVDHSSWVSKAKDSGALIIVGADPMSLCLIEAPGKWGADIVYGSTQRFGVPLGFGGPHAAYLATKDQYKRSLPGRIIGVSKDADDNPALRLALQTREQHIRREKARSNICTAQVLLAVMASMYAVYHGPQGLKEISRRIHAFTQQLAQGLKNLGYDIKHEFFFDTLCLTLPKEKIQELKNQCQAHEFNLYYSNEDQVQISLDEKTTAAEVKQLLSSFAKALQKTPPASVELSLDEKIAVPPKLKRETKFLEHPVFNTHHSETEMLRYIHSLQQKDLSLVHSMIPLGSCTMKLNATTEMLPITWPEFSNLHPFCPPEQTQGYMELIADLEQRLCEITGFDRISFQSNAGSQGEYAGLLIINEYHRSRGDEGRNICLIPSSAHGTNPASAVMAGLKVVVIECDEEGNIDVDHLKLKTKEHADHLAALMITYPSTHGVFEESLLEICQIIHDNGGQVYMDGANLNALMGLCQPGKLGPDVCHLNLHKTFCIPHGGGGPGVGPVATAPHLSPFLPGHNFAPQCGGEQSIPAISAAPWGSASILPISWAYLLLMGDQGLKACSEVAILSANYIAHRLEPHYPVLYRGKNNYVAHECIIDTRPFKETANITVDDIAKRLMDFGFHAPTMSWPVVGALMIEPTESESLAELDRFCEAMIQIKKEIDEITQADDLHKTNNMLKNAPHSIYTMTKDEWSHPYSRKQAAFPLSWVAQHKFWTPVSRVDNAFGDKNLVCSCPSLDSYRSE